MLVKIQCSKTKFIEMIFLIVTFLSRDLLFSRSFLALSFPIINDGISSRSHHSGDLGCLIRVYSRSKRRRREFQRARVTIIKRIIYIFSPFPRATRIFSLLLNSRARIRYPRNSLDERCNVTCQMRFPIFAIKNAIVYIHHTNLNGLKLKIAFGLHPLQV